MSTTTVAAPSSREQIASLRREIDREALLWVLPFLYLPAFVLFGMAGWLGEPTRATWPATILCISVVSSLLLRDTSHHTAAWLLVFGWVWAVLLLTSRLGLDSAIILLTLGVGLAALLIGTLAGMLTAAFCSVTLLWTPEGIIPSDIALRLATIALLWGTVGLLWLSRRPLITALEWSWTSTQQSICLLEEARDQRLRLKQALAERDEINLQLRRVNHLVQGLRLAAEEARRAKEQFVANVSHELRTPLNMILGFTEMILKNTEAYGRRIPSALLADLAVIQRNSQHLADLVDDVLDLSRVETGRMALTKERTAIAEIIETAVAAVRPLYQSKHLSLEVEIAPDLPLVFCDPTRIREAVLNLLSNAGRFTEKGGVRVRAWREGEQILVSVADTGPGIAAADQERLFRPFEQLDASLHRRYGGSGLGLSISKGFVELHGGKMWLESQLGVGTMVFFSLPIDPPPEADVGALTWLQSGWEYHQRARPSPLPAPPVKPRYVVAEKGNALSQILRRYLADAEVVQAPDLDTALRDIMHTPAHALLVNETSIVAGLQRLRVECLPQGTPAILCAVPEPSNMARQLGAVDYLVKPISRDGLLAALDRIAGTGRGLKKILIADDEDEARQLFWRILSTAGRGYRVLLAANGQQALELARAQHPDAILLDLIMPELDGFQFLEWRNQDPSLREIPVIIISARDPGGQPIVANALAVTQRDGLALPQLLGCIQGISRLLAPGRPYESKSSA